MRLKARVYSFYEGKKTSCRSVFIFLTSQVKKDKFLPGIKWRPKRVLHPGNYRRRWQTMSSHPTLLKDRTPLWAGSEERKLLLTREAQEGHL